MSEAAVAPNIQDLDVEILNLARRAKAASAVLATTPTEEKNRALRLMALALEEGESEIKEANAKDLANATSAKMSAALLDRLTLSPRIVQAMARGMREVADLPDPVGEVVRSWPRPNGLQVYKVDRKSVV